MTQEWSKKVVGDCPEQDYTVDETMQYIRTLLELDKEYKECIEKSMYEFLAYRMAATEKPHDIREAVCNGKNVRLSGSCADGGVICRWFRHGIPDAELDITFQMGVINPDKEGSILASIPEKPGFLKVYNSHETYECLDPILSQYSPELTKQFATQWSEQKFVNTKAMQDELSKIWPHTDDEGMINKITALLMGVDEKMLSVFYTGKIVGPATMMELILSLHDEKTFSFYSDNVLTFKVERFPVEMEPCLERFSKFLPPDDVEKLWRAHTYIVAKKSPGAKSEEEWRRSTSELERILMKTWCEPGKDQRMVCYFTLKCLYYRYIRGIEVGDRYFTSYALKTAMLWVIETIPPEEWTDTNFMKNMKRILNRMMDYVKDKNLPNYFIPEMNIIDPSEYPSDLTDAVAAKLAEMIQNLEAFMPRDLEKMVKQVRAILEGLNAVPMLINYMTMKVDQKRRQDAGARHIFGVEEVLHVLNSSGIDINKFVQGMFEKKPEK